MGNLLQTCLISSISLSILSLLTIFLLCKSVCVSKLSLFIRILCSGKESPWQFRRCKRHRFDPWVRKMPWRRKRNTLQYSLLKNSKDRGAWWATVHAVTKSQTRLSDWATEHAHILKKSSKEKICASNKVCLPKWCIRERNMRKPSAVLLVSATGRKSSFVLYSKMRWGGGNFGFGCVKCESLTTHPSRDSS